MTGRSLRRVPDPRSAAAHLDRRFARQIYWWALLTRAGVGILAWLLTRYWGLPLLQDALFYEQAGYGAAQEWLSGQPAYWLQRAMHDGREAWLIVAFVAVVYYGLQGVRAVPVLIVAYSLVTAWVPVLTYRITRLLGAEPGVAKWAAVVVVLSPAFAVWSGALYKDGLILLLLGIAVYHTLRLQRGWRPRSMGWLVLSVFALLGLRFYVAIMMAGVVACSLIWGRRPPAERPAPHRAASLTVLRQAFIVLAFFALIGVLGFQQQASTALAGSRDVSDVLFQLQRSRSDLAASAYSGYLAEADVSTPGAALRFFPRGLVYFLTVPWPWQIGRLRQNLVIPETLLWVLSYPLVLYGFRRALRTNRPGAMALAAFSAGICGVYALLSANIGVAYRMRTEVWLLWAPLLAIGWHEWRRRRSMARL
jgi:hypothetical protein